jgi:hypothetical protein
MLLMRSVIAKRIINTRTYCTPRFPSYKKIIDDLKDIKDIKVKSTNNSKSSYYYMYNSLPLKKN